VCQISLSITHTHITYTPYAFFYAFGLFLSFSIRFLLLSLFINKMGQINNLSFILGVYRRTPKDLQQMQPPQSASNNSKQQLPTGTDTGRSSSARVPKK
jgi:hypothetical protein